MTKSVHGRLAKLEARLPDPALEEREQEFLRQAAILNEIEAQLVGCPPIFEMHAATIEVLIEKSVPRALLGHGMSGEEVAELTPAYIAMFSEGLKGEEGGGASYGAL